MNLITISLGLSCENVTVLNDELLESNYQKIYKPLLQFLYSHPKLNFYFSFCGRQLEFLESKHPEVNPIIKELTTRHQIEILGGGYYNPIFPILFPVDRSGQIEKFTSELRASFGKRPRGMNLYESVWDPSLITTFQTCGMEYVLLENTLIPKNKRNFLPLIANEQCKTIKILPVYNEFVPDENENLPEWLSKITKTISKKAGDEENLNAVIEIRVEQMKRLLASDFLDFIDSICCDEKSSVKIDTPQHYLKHCNKSLPSYIPAGMSWNVAQWAQKPYESVDNKTHFPVTIHDYLNLYPQNHQLYERMMYMSMLINQIHGDKARKIAAREKLWEAQSGLAYLTAPENFSCNSIFRQASYKALIEAEKIVRECEEVKEDLTSFDYNSDGKNEYISRMKQYNAVISLQSGCISELDVFKSLCNYSDNLNRVEKYDGVEEKYQRNIFVEHLLEEEDKDNYLKGKDFSSGIFSQVQFEEKKFESLRKEIQIEGKGEFSSLQQPVSLRKKYIFNSNGMTIQYILKNNSPLSIKGCFIVESNFAGTDFEDDDFSQYVTDLIINGERKKLEKPDNFNTEEKISVIQLTDCVNSMSFLFEPNEDCCFACRPIVFLRPDSSETLQKAARTFVMSLYWNVELAAGREIEKTINLSIIPARKSRLK